MTEALEDRQATLLLRVLAEAEVAVPQNELPKHMSVVRGDSWVSFDKSELSRVLSKLEEYGYVRRTTSGKTKLVQMNM